MLEKLLFIGIGAAGVYLAYRTWPGKMPMPCPCNAASSGGAGQVQPNAYQTTAQPVRPPDIYANGGYA